MPDLHATRDSLPAALRDRARWLSLAGVPAMLALPAEDAGAVEVSIPLVIWLHGRTVTKELDPGRYVRWLRRGIAACALDLPGHGERFDAALQGPEATLEVVERMVGELDGVVAELRERAVELGLAPSASAGHGVFGIGGMSAGGMVALARLCTAHPFAAASVEATTGSWTWQQHRAMWDEGRAAALNPIARLDGWREIPLQAIHARHDEWVNVSGQQEFIAALTARARHPERIELEIFEERTGAPYEHAGFGRFGSVAKDLQLNFWGRTLLHAPPA